MKTLFICLWLRYNCHDIRINQGMKSRLILLFSLLCSNAAFALDGQALYFEYGCDSCHGEEGRANGRISLAGRPVDELVEKTLLIQHDQNPSGAELIMKENPDLNRLEAAQAQAIAQWLSQLPTSKTATKGAEQ